MKAANRRPTKSTHTLLLFAASVLQLVISMQLGAQDRDYPGDTLRFQQKRSAMVKKQIVARGVRDQKVIAAMRAVPRHLFIPDGSWSAAYGDHPLRIDEGQTISQPYIVAFMTEQLGLNGQERVLEIGTGSGYQAAVLSLMTKEVYSIEIKTRLHERATKTLQSLNFNNVRTIYGDGYYGSEEFAPFDCIMITAAVNHIPPPLLAQLTEGGRMILPLGSPYSYFGQALVLVTKQGEDYSMREILPVRFVPMTGKALERGR